MHYLAIGLSLIVGAAMIFVNVYAQQEVLSPLKQIKLGVLPQDVKCKDNFVLIIKKENGYPACVKPDTAMKLAIRGWSNISYKVISPIGIVQPQNIKNNHTTNNTTGSIQTVQTPLFPQFSVTPMYPSSQPSFIKVLSVGMLPNPLKVGDVPSFSIIYQNISNKSIIQGGGCGEFGYFMSPSSKVEMLPSVGQNCPLIVKEVNPNQTMTAEFGVPENKTSAYKITQQGLFNVRIDLFLSSQSSLEAVKTIGQIIRFSVNATN